MEIVPLVGSIILKRAKLRLDLPAPVRPTMPTCRNFHDLWASVFTFSLSKTSRLKFSRTQGNSGRYLVAYLTCQLEQNSGRNYYAPTQVNNHKNQEGIITHPSNLISPVDGQFSAKGTSDSQSASWVRCFSFKIGLLVFCCGTCGRSSYSRTLSRATLSDSSSPAILMTILMILIYFQSNIWFQPDCPTKPIDHLHRIGDRESNYPRA